MSLFYTNNAELATPLIGTLPQEVERQENKKSHDVAVEYANVDDSQSREVEEEEDTCCESFMSVLLYVLLFLQFGIFFYVEDPAVDTLDFSVVACSIFLFIVATHLYRNVLTEIGSSDIEMLLPEVIIVVSMGIAYFQHVVAAFLFLIAGKLFMALTVVLINAYRLCQSEEEDCKEQSSANYESLV